MRNRRCAHLAGALVLCAGGLGCGGGSEQQDAAWQETLDELSARAIALDIPGMAVAVVIDGRLAYAGGIGVQSRSSGEPVTEDTLFRSSSAVSKPAIAVALLELAQEGRLDLRSPIGDVVPAIQVDPAYADQIDLDHMLLQRSGLAIADYRPSCTAGEASVVSFFEHEGPLESSAPPGAIWEYTALASAAGAAAIQTVEGRPFTDVLKDRVLDPAGMVSATYDPTEVMGREHATGHAGLTELDPSDDPGLTCGERIASTGLYASAADHARFLELLLAPGRVLDQPSLDALQGAGHGIGAGPGWSYGYQVFGLDYKGVRVFHHYGSSEGYTNGVSWVPERGFGVVLLTNIGEGHAFANVKAVEELRWSIIDRFLGLTGDPPDNTTPPSTWGKYEGTFVDADAPDVHIAFALDADRLTVTVDPGQTTPVVLSQGTLDAPYQGGDVFSTLSGNAYFLVAFFPDDTGAIHYANVYSSVAGHLVTERVP